VSVAARGRLREAEREAAQAERLRRQLEPELGHLHALLVLASIRLQRGELERADAHLDGVRRGLEAFTDAGRLPELLEALQERRAQAAGLAAALDDAPSAAEVSVLKLLPTELSQREIGARLYLSLNTVKTHTRALYRKLGVTSRDAAIQRALALGLLEPDDSPG
jgi:LuxR family maltose regulon positive regulatory protein